MPARFLEFVIWLRGADGDPVVVQVIEKQEFVAMLQETEKAGQYLAVYTVVLPLLKCPRHL